MMIEMKRVELLKKKTRKSQPDPLISELEEVETQLRKWLEASEEHAQLFRRDPIAAMRAAGVDLEDDTIMELELIASAIARKLR
jgi:hypothetical protein